MKTALIWLALIGVSIVSYTLGSPPWLQTLALFAIGIAFVISLSNLEEKIADARLEQAMLKESLEAQEREMIDLERRIYDLEKKN